MKKLKNLKGIMSLLLMVCMVISVFAGCKKDESTLFTVLEEVYSFENYTFTESGVIIVDDNEITFEASGVVNGTNCSVSLDAAYGAYEVELGEVLIYLNDSLYVNIESIADAVSRFIPGMNVKSILEDTYDIPVGWYELPLSQGYMEMCKERSVSQKELYMTMLQETLNGIEIKKDNNTFTIDVNNVEQIVLLMENAATMIENHNVDFVELTTDMQSEDIKNAMVEMLEIYGDAVINTMVKMNEEKNLGMTDEEIQKEKDDMQAQIEDIKNDELVEVTDEMKKEMETSLDEAVASIRESANKLKDYDMGNNPVSCVISNSLTGKNNKKEYKMNLNLSAIAEESEVTVTIDSLVKQENAEVKLPENVYKLDEWLYKIMSFAYDYAKEEGAGI